MLVNLVTTPILLYLLVEAVYGLQSLVAVIIVFLKPLPLAVVG
jgi:hypothetical protein